MKINKISTKIKILGALLIFATFAVIVVTTVLNQKNVSDALIVNIAGKERMLSQKISKNIFYLKVSKSADFKELDAAVSKFVNGLEILKNGSQTLRIRPAPTQDIRTQIVTIQNIWEPFLDKVNQFKVALSSHDSRSLTESINYIAANNEALLEEVDQLVTMYTDHIEEKTNFIKYFQYGAIFILFLLVSFSILKLKRIESHAQEFLLKSKELMRSNIQTPIDPLDIDSEEEIQEVANSLNHFVKKVNSVVSYSQSAIEQSKHASQKLEDLTYEFEMIIEELDDQKAVESHLDKSEDMMIQSSEDLIRSTKKLEKLKMELDTLLSHYKRS
ncbi:MAG: type IV pili methyl-accepting chemotaxis transducer N-terminal domain-containing protein [Campylobacterota bacterium]